MDALETIKGFYRARATNDLDAVSAFLAQDVRWLEPSVGDHMGTLIGSDAVIDMMHRALATTGGSFSLRVAEGVQVTGHCSVVVEWSAQKGETTLNGRELATFTVQDGKITFAQFLPENIADDNIFWGE